MTQVRRVMEVKLIKAIVIQRDGEEIEKNVRRDFIVQRTKADT